MPTKVSGIDLDLHEKNGFEGEGVSGTFEGMAWREGLKGRFEGQDCREGLKGRFEIEVILQEGIKRISFVH